MNTDEARRTDKEFGFIYCFYLVKHRKSWRVCRITMAALGQCSLNSVENWCGLNKSVLVQKGKILLLKSSWLYQV